MTLEQRNPSLKVAIVSHNLWLLLGLRTIFEEHSSIEVVGDSSGGSSAGSRLVQQRPDVILVDLDLDFTSEEGINDLRKNTRNLGLSY